MVSRRTIAVLAAAIPALAACNGSDPAGCTSTDACPSGNVCKGDGKCYQLCENDQACARGSHCEGDICVDGDRGGTPTITQVAGMSSRVCTDPQGGGVIPCIGAGFVVTGTYLAGAAWKLESASPARSYTLLASATSTATRAEITVSFPSGETDLADGMYTLTATNQAGADTQTVSLLRGEQGPQGPAGPAGTGSGGKLFKYGGGIAYTGTETVPTATLGETKDISPDRMFVSVDAQDGSSDDHRFGIVKLDDTKLLELCADEDGCNIRMAVRGFVYTGTYRIDAPWSSMDCRMYMTPRSNGRSYWATGVGCTGDLFGPRTAATSAPDRPQDIWGSELFDMDNGQQSDGLSYSTFVMWYRNICVLAEAPPNANCTSASSCPDGALAVDNSPGLYFFVTHSGYMYGGSTTVWPPGTPRSCELIIED